MVAYFTAERMPSVLLVGIQLLLFSLDHYERFFQLRNSLRKRYVVKVRACSGYLRRNSSSVFEPHVGNCQSEPAGAVSSIGLLSETC